MFYPQKLSPKIGTCFQNSLHHYYIHALRICFAQIHILKTLFLWKPTQINNNNKCQLNAIRGLQFRSRLFCFLAWLNGPFCLLPIQKKVHMLHFFIQLLLKFKEAINVNQHFYALKQCQENNSIQNGIVWTDPIHCQVLFDFHESCTENSI